ncbi:MAG: terminase large subunit [Steroidobacteraceae bacterium]|nr:terminase large subunit [Steroidobacteraceae bacterium]
MRTKRKRRASSHEDRDSRFVFDADAADRAVRFIEARRLRGEGGEDAGKLVLMPWQRDVVRAVAGWKERRTGRRRYRRVSIWIPRGNGKTPLAVALMLWLLYTSGVNGFEGYFVAADREQAGIAFADAEHMIRSSTTLARESNCFRRVIQYRARGSTLKVMSREAKSKHGYRPYAVLFDELHTQVKRDLWAAMKTGLGKGKRDTLLISISTAGVYDPESLGYTEYAYARKVADGVIDDPHFLPVIFEADPAVAQDGRWKDQAVWAACNPGLGITLQREVLEDEARQAAEDPAALNDFLQLRLNIWVQSAIAALNPEDWAACDAPVVIKDRPVVYAGMDVGEKDDLTALGLWLPHEDRTASALVEIFMPESKVLALSHRHQVDYVGWMREGWVRPSGTQYVDTDDMRRRLRELREIYDIREVAFDPWNAYRTAQQLADEDRFVVVEMPQTMKHLSEATKEFIQMVVERRLRHGGNPVLRWMASNLVLFRDGKGNVVPQKQGKSQKVDGIVALINAFARARLASEKPSVYQTRGLVIL